MTTEQFRTVKDVAELLKVGQATVRRWVKDGEMRAIDIGRGWRIDPEDLNEFLRQHANRPHGNEETAARAVEQETPAAPDPRGRSILSKGKGD